MSFDKLTCKAEFFNRTFDFTFWSRIPEPEIMFDYLTLEKTSIIIPAVVDILRGWYCHITQGADVIYQGIVSGVDTDNSVTTVQLSPLLALFEFQFFYDRKMYNNNKTDLESWLRSAILEAFAGSDAVQNIPGLTVTAATHTDGVDLNLKDNVHDFWDLAKKAMESAKIAIVCEFDPMAKTVTAVIRNHSDDSELTMEADLPNVTEQTFYAADYAAPTVQRVAEITVEEGETFATAAREKSAELMRKADFDNLIELTYRESDKIIAAMQIGQPVRVLKKGVGYHTVLTGITSKGDLKTYVFGGIRVDLTKILKLKGAI